MGAGASIGEDVVTIAANFPDNLSVDDCKKLTTSLGGQWTDVISAEFTKASADKGTVPKVEFLKIFNNKAVAAAAVTSTAEVAMSKRDYEVVINEDQFMMYKKEFDEADTDNDGSLTRREVAALLRKRVGKTATKEFVTNWMLQIDDSEDGRVQVEEWIRAVIGKDYKVSDSTLQMIKVRNKKVELPVSKDGKPLCIGFVYKFVTGMYRGEVGAFKGLVGKGGAFATKSAVAIDDIGRYTGMAIVTSDFSDVVLSNEKEAWEHAQRASAKECKWYKKKGKDKDYEKTKLVAKGYVKFTGVSIDIE